MPAGQHTLRVVLARGRRGPVVSDAGAVFGVGVYATHTTRILGYDVADSIEDSGRTWVLDHAVRGTPDSRTPVDTQISTTDGDRLIGMIALDGSAGISFHSDTVHGSSAGVANGGQIVGGTLFAGDTYQSPSRASASGRSVRHAVGLPPGVTTRSSAGPGTGPGRGRLPASSPRNPT